MNIELKFAGDFLRFEEVELPQVKKSIFKKNRFPDEIDFFISVKSGEFTGRVRTLVLGRDGFENLLAETKKLYEMQIETVEFKTSYGDAIELSLNKQGQMEVSGVIVEPVSGQSLKFGFNADQTSIPPFIDGLEKLVNKAAK